MSLEQWILVITNSGQKGARGSVWYNNGSKVGRKSKEVKVSSILYIFLYCVCFLADPNRLLH